MKSCHLQQHGWTLRVFTPNEISQRVTNIVCFTWNLNKANEQTKQAHRYRKPVSGYQRGRSWGRGWKRWIESTVWWWRVIRLVIVIELYYSAVYLMWNYSAVYLKHNEKSVYMIYLNENRKVEWFHPDPMEPVPCYMFCWENSQWFCIILNIKEWV